MFIHEQTLEDRAAKARGDSTLSGSLIREFKPFIASVAQKSVGRYLRYGTDEELSVGLLAFKEAIDSFNHDMSLTILRDYYEDYFKAKLK